jgi:hypothetical protein
MKNLKTRRRTKENDAIDSDLDVFEPDASNGLSWEKVQYEVDRAHPRLFAYDKPGKSGYK